jgi:ABC-type polysaccharide/polyol phosphate transport system ATPase subunit
MDVIELAGVSKKYKMYHRPGERLKELLFLNRRRYHREHWAVRDVSLSIRAGEMFCVIGENGSGKSTLLKLMLGILQPTAGIVKLRGRVTALIELGLGFNPEFTGRANVYMNGAILGLSKAQTAEKLKSILEFAEIGSYIDQPVKTYSSGMIVRLAFAVAVHLDPDILIVDEALAVGDIYFRQRCMRKIHELRSRGVTIVYVTHDMGDVKMLGDRAVWLRNGQVMELGDARAVATNYLAALVKKDSDYLRSKNLTASVMSREPHRPKEIVTWLPAVIRRHGDGRAEILGIQVCDDCGRPLDSIQTPSSIIVRISARARQELPLPIVGVLLRVHGADFTGTNTSREEFQLPPMLPGDTCTVDFHLKLPELSAAGFTLTPAVADGTLVEFQLCDMVEDAIEVSVLSSKDPVYGYMHLPCLTVHASRSGQASSPTDHFTARRIDRS